ncbi:MAG: ABC transporter ATP-binding protein [Paludibacteraceae bacterium]
MPILSTHHLQIGYSKGNEKTSVQTDLNLELRRGEMVCLIGPNGTGKSTLLRTLSGLQKALKGDVVITGKLLTKISYRERALKIALVLTDKVQVENARVFDIVALGQFPYSHWLKGLDSKANDKITEAIKMVHLEDKSSHFINELSDGERQRVMIAKALAQDTPLIFLDEPTAHLDLPNRVEIMLLLHKLAHQTNKAILLSTHELDLALQAADKIWLMDKNGVINGVPEDMVLNGTFNRVFKSDAYFFNPANGNFSMNYALHKKVHLSGEKTKMYWTLRALARAGYFVTEDAEVKIVIGEKDWHLNNKHFSTIDSLLSELDTFVF